MIIFTWNNFIPTVTAALFLEKFVGQRKWAHFDIAGPLTESVLMGNLAIRSYYVSRKDGRGRDTYPGRNIKLMWDGPNMKVTNFDEANQFVKRTYREGWSLGV